MTKHKHVSFTSSFSLLFAAFILVVTVIGLLFSYQRFSLSKPVSAITAGQTPMGYTGGDDWEPAVALDNAGHVYVIYPHYGGVPNCASCPSPTVLFQMSSDNGTTWTAPKVLTPNDLGTYQVDTQIMVDPMDHKTVYASWLQNSKSKIVLTKSTDYGQTWSNLVTVNNSNAGTDKPIMTVKGNDVYVGYSRNKRVFVAASHDGGVTFTSSSVPSPVNAGYILAGGAGIDSKNNVYFSWVEYNYVGQNLGPSTLFVSKSTNKGSTWTNTVVDTSAAPTSCPAAFKCGFAYLGAQMALNVNPVDPSNVVKILWNKSSVDNGPAMMYYATSLDNFVSHQVVTSNPSSVNHSFPAITSGSAPGDVRIAWMDNRTNGKYNVYYKKSANNGSTWGTEVKLSSYIPGYSYLNSDGFILPYGDYFELDVDNQNNTQAVWGEGPSFAGPGNVWYSSTP